MANIDQFLQRNKDFAASGAHEGASIIARHQVYLITCLDPRTDPTAFLELDLGDAMVVRNTAPRDRQARAAFVGAATVVAPAIWPIAAALAAADRRGGVAGALLSVSIRGMLLSRVLVG